MRLKNSWFFSALILSCSSAAAFAQEAQPGKSGHGSHENMTMPGSPRAPQGAIESPFMKETMAAMDSMHKEMMEGSKMNGMPDHDFMVMMIPHHKGALQMAEIYLKYGTDDKVKKLARNIASAQKKEIAQMEKWLKNGANLKN